MNSILSTLVFFLLSTLTAYAQDNPEQSKATAVENSPTAGCRPSAFPSSEEREAEAQRTDGCPCFVPLYRLSSNQDNGCYLRKGKVDNYSNGFVCTYFDRSGMLCQETAFSNGMKDGVSRRYGYSSEAKVLHSEIPYKRGKEEGVVKYFHYYTGELRTEINYVNGQKEGVAKEYFKSGNLQKETLYKNGEEEGVIKVFDEKGKDITNISCLHPSVTCLPAQKRAALKALDERRAESGITTGPLTVDVKEWFSYVDHQQAGQVALLSRKKCPVKWAGVSAMNAKMFVPTAQKHIPACWYESSNVDDNGSPIVVVCLRDLKEMGTSCNRYSKRYFLNTSSLPRSGF